MEKLLIYILNLVLPINPLTREIELISPENFKLKMSAPLNNLPQNTCALFNYKNAYLKQAIWELKYRGNKKIVSLLARCLYDELTAKLGDMAMMTSFEKPLLIPIPLFKSREHDRGFNQCVLLTNELKKEDDGNFFEVDNTVLSKTKNTKSQTKMNRLQRLENMKNCFYIQFPEKISGRNIILLDDVITTGATLTEARKTLTQCGAKKIITIAIAH